MGSSKKKPNTFYLDTSEKPHFSSQCSSQRTMIEHFKYTRDLQQIHSIVFTLSAKLCLTLISLAEMALSQDLQAYIPMLNQVRR